MAWPLTGRDAEVAAFRDLLADRDAGGVVVTGEAGVGKTRLADEFARIAESAGHRVERVWATRSAASIPLGALAPLLPVLEDDARSAAELLARTRRELAARAGGRRLVLCADDGQWLDSASATLTHQLVTAREAFVVVTVRSDEPSPDALRALWKDERCVLMPLGTLSREEVERVLEAALGAPVDGRGVEALWDKTRGNALFLRELVRLGLERGRLANRGGIWRWDGEPAAGLRLAELVETRLAGLGAGPRRLLEVLAAGAPLELGLLAGDEVEALEALEREDVVVWRADGRRRSVDVAHPLHGEVVRTGMTGSRLEAAQRRLADAVEAHGARRRGDLPRLAAWRLALGDAEDPALFERAADRALGVLDPPGAERFARAAVGAGGGFRAELLLARALAGGGRPEEAQVRLDRLSRKAASDDERAAVAIATAQNVFWGLDRAEHAAAALLDGERRIADAGVRSELAGHRVRLLAAHDRPQVALDAATALLEDPGAREPARLHAAVGAAEALISLGRTDAALRLIEDWLPAAGRLREAWPVPEQVLRNERAIALRFAGRLQDATADAARNYTTSVSRGSAQPTALDAAALGYAWLARGRVRTALRYFHETAGLLRDMDTTSMLAWGLAGVAQAAAQLADPGAARTAVEEMGRQGLANRSFACELGLARAWSAAAAGELTRARALAGETAALARSRGQVVQTVRCLHERCRLGDPAAAAAELAELAGRVDGDWAWAAVAHAAALVAHDGFALLAVAERFSELGALLVAAEAADAAAAALAEKGRAASARSAAARSAAWLRACEGARPATLVAAGLAGELTGREREIALLAASGLTSREIADRLVVSVRTVDNHLQRTYGKLGISGRSELVTVLGEPA